MSTNDYYWDNIHEAGAEYALMDYTTGSTKDMTAKSFWFRQGYQERWAKLHELDPQGEAKAPRTDGR